MRLLKSVEWQGGGQMSTRRCRNSSSDSGLSRARCFDRSFSNCNFFPLSTIYASPVVSQRIAIMKFIFLFCAVCALASRESLYAGEIGERARRDVREEKERRRGREQKAAIAV